MIFKASGLCLGIVDVGDDFVPDADEFRPFGLVRRIACWGDGDHVVDEARLLGRRVEGVRARRAFHGFAGDRLPGTDRGDIARRQDLRRLVGLGVDQRHIRFGPS